MPSFAASFEMLYHPLLITEMSFEALMKSDVSFDFLILEGALSHDGSLIQKFNTSFEQTLDALALRAKYIVCAGSCASFGGIFRLQDTKRISGALFSGKEKGGYWAEKENVINLPGCPLHPRWLVDTLLLLHHGEKVSLDAFLRLKRCMLIWCIMGVYAMSILNGKWTVKSLEKKRVVCIMNMAVKGL